MAQIQAAIDNQAAEAKGQLIQQGLTTGEGAYGAGTALQQQGGTDITSAYDTAVQDVNTNFSNAMSEITAGLGPLEDSINLQISGNTALTNALNQMFGAIASGYAQSKPGTTGGGTSGGGGSVGIPSVGGGGGGAGSIPTPNAPGTGSGTDTYGTGVSNSNLVQTIYGQNPQTIVSPTPEPTGPLIDPTNVPPVAPFSNTDILNTMNGVPPVDASGNPTGLSTDTSNGVNNILNGPPYSGSTNSFLPSYSNYASYTTG